MTQGATGHPTADAELKLPWEMVQPMLARGAVKIPYGHLRQLAPGLFPALAGKDTLEVDLPLNEVLARVKPEMLARRPQKKIEVPDDIGPVFGAGGANLRVADAKTKSPAPPVPPAPAEPAAKVPAPKPAEPIPAKPAPEPPNPSAPPGPAAPVARPPVTPISPISPVSSEPAAPIRIREPEPAPLVNEPIRAPKLDPALATLKPKTPPPPPIPAPAPAPAPLAVADSSAGSIATKEGIFSIALNDLAPHWAGAGKTELSNLKTGTLEIPSFTLESALKTGKLVFPWREVRTWLSGASAPALDEETLVDLPLPIVAPRFMAQRVARVSKKRLEVSDEIPDLFAKKTSPAAALPEPAGPVPGPSPSPAPTLARPVLDFGDIFGQPEKKSWSFQEITQKTTTLRGVAGALIATTDGLLVAGTWPNVENESVAAFVPQMYSRMIQCTRELKLGEPGNFTLLIESVPLQIFQIGGNYFAVLGRAGENLPKAQLGALATRLAAMTNNKAPTT